MCGGPGRNRRTIQTNSSWLLLDIIMTFDMVRDVNCLVGYCVNRLYKDARARHCLHDPTGIANTAAHRTTDPLPVAPGTDSSRP